MLKVLADSQGALVVKNLPASAGDLKDPGLIPGSGRSWRKARQPIPVFLPVESRAQRGLAGYIVHRVTKSWETAEHTQSSS